MRKLSFWEALGVQPLLLQGRGLQPPLQGVGSASLLSWKEGELSRADDDSHPNYPTPCVIFQAGQDNRPPAPPGGRGEARAGGSLPGKLQHLRHHGPDPVVDVVERRLTHEGWGRDHLVFLVHVSFVHRS